MENSQLANANGNLVHIGREGWLFLISGSNNVLELFKNKSAFTKQHAKGWVNLLKERNKRLTKQNIQYVHIPAPEKLTVLHPYYRGELENLGGSPITQLAKKYQKKIPCFINPLPTFLERSTVQPLYWKTDSHWGFWGCYAAYQLLCQHLHVAEPVNFPEHDYKEVCRLFDLGIKLPDKPKETANIYQILINGERVQRNKLVAFKEDNDLSDQGSLHAGSGVVFKNKKAKDQRKVIIFGDSFSEYRPQSLTGMLAETFAEVHFIWNASLDYDYIDAAKPDIVISELAERFMTRIPIDDLNISKFIDERIIDYTTNNPDFTPKVPIGDYDVSVERLTEVA